MLPEMTRSKVNSAATQWKLILAQVCLYSIKDTTCFFSRGFLSGGWQFKYVSISADVFILDSGESPCCSREGNRTGSPNLFGIPQLDQLLFGLSAAWTSKV